MAYRYRPLLTILVWGLLLEILTIIYYASAGEFDRFEFQLTLFLTVATAAAIAILLRKIIKEIHGRA